MHRCRLEWRFNRNTQDKVSKIARAHEGSELSNVIERRKRVLRYGDNDNRGIDLKRFFVEFLGMLVKLKLRIGSTAARGIIQRQGCGLPKHIETKLLWPQAKHEERKLTVVKEPTQKNAAGGITKALQTAKYLEWRNRLGMGYDIGDDVETSKREALAESGRWARVEALHAIPRSVLISTLMQQTFVTRRRGWNDCNWLSKA